MMLRLTESVATRGELSVKPIAGFESYATALGPDNELYTKYGLALSIAALPLYGVGTLLESVIDQDDLEAFQGPRLLYYDRTRVNPVIRTFITALTNSWVTALTFTIIASILLHLGFSTRSAALAALSGGLLGTTPFYAKTFFSEPLAGLCLAGCAWCMVRFEGKEQKKLAYLAGLLLGLSALTRVAHLILFLPAAVALQSGVNDTRNASRHRAAYAVIGAMLPVGILLLYNTARFGSVFETGYGAEAAAFSGDPLHGLAGLIASPGRGILWYVPWVVPAMFGLPLLWRKNRRLTVFIGGSFVTLLGLYSPWHMWEGGWCLGPRFLVPVIPLLIIPAAVFCKAFWSQTWFRGVCFLVIAFGLAFVTQAIRINYLDFHYAAYSLEADIQQTVRWSFDWSPIIAYWGWPESNFLLLPRILVGQGGPWLQGVAVAIVLGLTSTTYRMMRILSTAPNP